MVAELSIVSRKFYARLELDYVKHRRNGVRKNHEN